MLRILGTIFAALLGLCFGSFLNVCLSRWPAGESVVHPRSHCRACGRTLAWWENVPLVSWIALRGRCRSCGAWISVRYPLVEVLVAILWAVFTWRSPEFLEHASPAKFGLACGIFLYLAKLALGWVVVALAALDAENLWLPDRLTLPGISLGFLFAIVGTYQASWRWNVVYDCCSVASFDRRDFFADLAIRGLACLITAAIILLIRWVYWLIRRREGMGLGDAKLMAMLAAWLGLQGALLSLFLGVVLGAVYAVAMLAGRSRRSEGGWATAQLPLGTFLCIGGIISALWGQQIIGAYLRLFP